MAEGSEQLLIRFRGICGHIELPNGRNGDGRKKRRTILVRHRNGNAGIEHHIAYIEFYADDVQSASPELKVVQYSRPGVDGRFARINLEDGIEIRLKNIPPGRVEEELSFQRDVPHISEVLPKFQIAKGLLVPDAKDVDVTRAAAVFDMPDGRLVGGEPEALTTRFEPFVGFKERRLARWTDLYIRYEAPLVLELVPLGGGAVREIVFKETLRMITIGNEPERLILGIIGSRSAHVAGQEAAHNSHATPVQRTGHYVLFYELLENPESRPVPIPTQLEGTGCPNNVYP